MSRELVIGAILSIPISFAMSIGAGLLLPKLQNWVDRRKIAKGQAAETKLRSDYELTLFFAAHKHELTHYILTSVALLISAVGVTVLGNILFAAGMIGADLQVQQIRRVIYLGYEGLGFIATMVGLFLSTKITDRVFKLHSQVLRIREYVKTLPDQIRDHALEEKMLAHYCDVCNTPVTLEEGQGVQN